MTRAHAVKVSIALNAPDFHFLGLRKLFRKHFLRSSIRRCCFGSATICSVFVKMQEEVK